MDDKRLQFLSASLGDIQNTIRATDTKVGLLMVILLVPISSLSKIYAALVSFYAISDSRCWKLGFSVYLLLFALAWLTAFISAFRVLISIRNPSEHVQSPPEGGGRFYRGGLFRLRLMDMFRNPPDLKSSRSVKELVDSFPTDVEVLVEEMVFEQMKLAYIRDIKSLRQNWAYRFAFIWLILGFLGEMGYLMTRHS